MGHIITELYVTIRFLVILVKINQYQLMWLRFEKENIRKKDFWQQEK